MGNAGRERQLRNRADRKEGGRSIVEEGSAIEIGLERIVEDAATHKMAPRRTYAEIATALNRAGLRSAFGRRFTSQHVGYICRRDRLDRREQRSGSKMHDSPGAGGPANVE